MQLHDIPTKRLTDALTMLTPRDTKLVFGLYTREGFDSIEVSAEQVRTEIKVRLWRQS